MANGGILVKYDGKFKNRCYFVSFDYDAAEVKFNDDPPENLPRTLKVASIIMERTRTQLTKPVKKR